MTHDEAHKLLPLLAVSELDEDLRAAVTQHVALCPHCAAELHDLTAACDLLHAAMDAPAEPRLSLDPSRRSALLAAAEVAVDTATPTAKADPVGSEDQALEMPPIAASADTIATKLPVREKPIASSPIKLGTTVQSPRGRRRSKAGGMRRIVSVLAALFVVGLGLALVSGVNQKKSAPSGVYYSVSGNSPASQIVMGAATESESLAESSASGDVFKSLDRDGTRVTTEMAEADADYGQAQSDRAKQERNRAMIEGRDLRDMPPPAMIAPVPKPQGPALLPRPVEAPGVVKEVPMIHAPSPVPSTTTQLSVEENGRREVGQNETKKRQEEAGSDSRREFAAGHPPNQWMNALFIDGHAEGGRPDNSKGLDSGDGVSGTGGSTGRVIDEKKREVTKSEGEKDAYRSDVDRSVLRDATESSVAGTGSTSVAGKLAPTIKAPAVPGMSDELAIVDQRAQNGRDAGWSVQNRARVGGDLNGTSEEFREAGASWFEIDKQSGGSDGVVTLGGEQRENLVAKEDLRLRYERREAASPVESPADDASGVETKKGYLAPFTVDASTDLSTQYNWRGAPVADEPVAQPQVAQNYEGFALNGWTDDDLTNADGTRTENYSDENLAAARSDSRDSNRTIDREVTGADKDLRYDESTRRRVSELILAGEEARLNGDYETAVESYSRAEETMGKQMNKSEAAKLQDRISSTYLQWGDFLVAEGDAAKSPEKFDMASSKYSMAVQKNPALVDAISEKTKSLEEMQKRAELGEDLQASVVDPELESRNKRVSMAIERGKVFEKQGRYLRAREQFEIASMADPTNREASRQLEGVYEKLHEDAQARRWSMLRDKFAEVDWKWIDPVHPFEEPEMPWSIVPKEEEAAIVATKLKEIRLPKIKFDDAPVSDVVRYLKERSAQLDVVNGTGINIFLVNRGTSLDEAKNTVAAPAADDFSIDDFDDISAPGDLSDIPAPFLQEATVGSTITMGFDDVPLGEAIRYLCQGANPKLDYKIVGDSVLIFPAGTDPHAKAPGLSSEQVAQQVAARRAAAMLASLPKGTARVPHQVTGGETVEDIAMMYGADPEWVAAANPQLLNGGPLEPGTTIQVPMPPVVERYAPSQEAEGLPPAPKKAAPPVNPFVMTAADRLSTFALEADTASYTLSRRYIRSGYCPPKAVVRMEEFINSFDYNYPTQAENTFNIYASAAQSPFRPDLTLLKVGVKAKVVGRDGRKPSHLIFVVDASGSMATDDRLPLVKHALSLLLGQLDGSDRVSIVTYGTQGTLLREATSVEQRPDLVRTIQGIQPGTSTNMVDGIEMAYKVAQRNFQAGEINRIILCSDGIANVGAQTAEQILELVSARRKQGITFTSVGVGAGAYDDRMLEQLANRGDGNYVYIDSREQARKVFVDEFSATLQTVAKDAKIQVDFDPKRVRRYRLIGYENRDIADADFRNDSVDAGEINSGQSATALYELELLPTPPGEAPGDLGTVFVRYQNVDTEQVEEIATRLTADLGPRVSQPSTDPYFLLAASAAEFAEHLRGSEYAQGSSLPDIQRVLSKVLAQLPGNTQATGLQELTIRADGLPEYR